MLMVASVIIFFFGLWDDARGLSAAQKFIGQVLAAILLISSGLSVQFLNGLKVTILSPLFINIIQWLITIFWLTGITNSINMIDSMDGLAAGITGIAFAFFMGMAMAASQNELALFSAIFLGICIGLFFFNSQPARLFLGDSGAQTLGFILAAVAILYVPENLPQESSWFVPIMVMGVPIFDTVLVVVSRIRRKKSIFRADCAHTYHRLVALGFDPNRAVLVINLAGLMLNFLAFIALTLSPIAASILFGTSLLVGLGLLIFFEYKGPPVPET
jgi:UDP-GlcNAc:undecaprenyl-phosphate GlcNAc-1-phosphate transferase